MGRLWSKRRLGQAKLSLACRPKEGLNKSAPRLPQELENIEVAASLLAWLDLELSSFVVVLTK